MDAKKCDRCGNFYTEKEPNALQSLLTGLLEYHPFLAQQQVIESQIDLCPECSRDLTKWLKMKPTHESEGKANECENLGNTNG